MNTVLRVVVYLIAAVSVYMLFKAAQLRFVGQMPGNDFGFSLVGLFIVFLLIAIYEQTRRRFS